MAKIKKTMRTGKEVVILEHLYIAGGMYNGIITLENILALS